MRNGGTVIFKRKFVGPFDAIYMNRILFHA